MSRKSSYPSGRWPSPISASSVAEGALRFGRVQVVGGAVYWSEGRPAEGGRTAILRWTAAGGLAEMLPAPFSARSRVHEYGGGEFLVAGERLYFVNDSDQDIYSLSVSEDEAGARPQPADIRRLTADPDTRFADPAFDGRRGRLIAVAERHDPDNPGEVQNALWSIPTGGGAAAAGARALIEGRDFYASPRVSPDGGKLCFLAWDLPHMPWDAAALYVAEIAPDGSPKAVERIAGGDGNACFQPEWGPDGALYFVWDKDGYGNLFRWREGAPPQQVTRLEAELSRPLWSFGAASYAFLGRERVYLSFIARGEQGAAIFDLGAGTLTKRETGLTAVQTLSAEGDRAALISLSDNEPLFVALDDTDTGAGASAPPRILRRASEQVFDPGYVPAPRRIEIPGEGGHVSFGTLYPPANTEAEGPSAAPPPLVISLHGGPTSASARGLKARTLYFTSRGFAWLDLDYSGSTGYGRAFRERLRGQWGVRDVEDAIAAAAFAGASGLADPGAIFVTGGSAGGYTVLMAIARSNAFRGAASYYGICDLEALQRTTHKFERGYQAGLLGASLEENAAVYRERSALTHADKIATPLILFQGVEDYVVPKQQSIMIAEALRAKGLTVEYHEFEGEGHGFRKADTIRRTLELELEFYQRLLPGS